MKRRGGAKISVSSATSNFCSPKNSLLPTPTVTVPFPPISAPVSLDGQQDSAVFTSHDHQPPSPPRFSVSSKAQMPQPALIPISVVPSDILSCTDDSNSSFASNAPSVHVTATAQSSVRSSVSASSLSSSNSVPGVHTGPILGPVASDRRSFKFSSPSCAPNSSASPSLPSVKSSVSLSSPLARFRFDATSELHAPVQSSASAPVLPAEPFVSNLYLSSPSVPRTPRLDDLPKLLNVTVTTRDHGDLRMLLDCGSNVTLLSLSTMKEWHQDQTINRLAEPVVVNGVSGRSATHIIGWVNLPIKMSGSHEFGLHCWVVDFMPRAAIFGLDSIRAIQARVDFNNQSLRFPAFRSGSHRNPDILVSLEEDPPLSPHSSSVACVTTRRAKLGVDCNATTVQLKPTATLPDGLYLFQPAESESSTSPSTVLPVPSIIRLTTQRGMAMAQRSSTPQQSSIITIPKNSPFGTLSSLAPLQQIRQASACLVYQALATYDSESSDTVSVSSFRTSVENFLTEAPDASVKLNDCVEELWQFVTSHTNSAKFDNHSSANPSSSAINDKRPVQPAKPPADLLSALADSINPDLPTKKKQKVLALLEQHWSAFVPPASPALDVECPIRTPEGITVDEPIRSMHFIKRQAILESIQKWLKLDIIEVSDSAWNHPLVVVKKPHGRGWRVCLDLRELNKIMIPSKLAVPSKVDIQLDLRLRKFRFGSSADLNNAFLQVKTADQDRHKLAFQPFRDGPKYAFKRMIWGLQNAPAIMQAHMLRLAEALSFDDILVYIDDVLIWSEDFESHLKQIDEFLQKIIDRNMSLSPAKCRWGFEALTYIGRVISKEGVSPDPEFTSPLLSLSPPKTAKDLNSLLGAFGWFREHIPHFEDLVAPLRRALARHRSAATATRKAATRVGAARRKVSPKSSDASIVLNWMPELDAAFEALKQAASSPETLALPVYDEKTPFHVFCDASDDAFFGALFQNGKPIGFFSKSDVANEKKRYKKALAKSRGEEREVLKLIHSYEREAGALFLTLRHFEAFLHGVLNPIIAFTDHAPLTYIQSNTSSKKFAGWVNYLTEFPNLRIAHIPGVDNELADFGTRHTGNTSARKPSTNIASVDSTSPSAIDLAFSVPISVFFASTSLDEWRHRHQDQGFHCICRQRDTPDPDGIIWILCDRCNKAFHRVCVNRPCDDAASDSGPFTCPHCTVWHDFESGKTAQMPPEFVSPPVRFPLLLRRIKRLHIDNHEEVVAKRAKILAEYNKMYPNQPSLPSRPRSLLIPHRWFIDARGVVFRWQKNHKKVENGNWAVWVPAVPSKLRQQCLHWAHTSVIGGHRADSHRLLHSEFAWEHSAGEMSAFVSECTVCLAAKNHPQARWMEPDSILELVFAPNDLVCGDFVEMAPNHGYIGVFVLCDAASRFVQLTPVKSKDSAESLTAIRKWYYNQGRMEWLHLDNFRPQQGGVFREWLWQFGVMWSFISPHNSGGNGVVERIIRSIREQVRIKLEETQDSLAVSRVSAPDWPSSVDMVEATLNNTIHSATGYAPLELFRSAPRRFFASESDLLHHDGFLGLKRSWTPPPGARVSIATEKEIWRRRMIQARSNQKVNASPVVLGAPRGLKVQDFTVGDYVAVMDKSLFTTAGKLRHLRPRCVPIEITNDEMLTKKRITGIDAFNREWTVSAKFIVRKLAIDEATRWIAVLRRRHELAKLSDLHGLSSSMDNDDDDAVVGSDFVPSPASSQDLSSS